MKSQPTIPANQWLSFERIPALNISAEFRCWLLDRGSLTRKLRHIGGSSFTLHKLSQQWQRPTLSEVSRLGAFHSGELAKVREIEMHCFGEPWVFARSVLPIGTLTGRLRWLRNLDSRPLGELLFNDPSMRRARFEIARLDSHYFPKLKERFPGQQLWGRRSLFYLDDRPLLVAEIFLPAAEKHADLQN